MSSVSFLGDWVARNREKQGLTLEDLATKSKTSKSSIWALEAGTNRPRIDSADKICKALGTPLWKALQQLENANGKSRSAARKRA